MAPEPVATAIDASGLLRVDVWGCLGLQTEGGSAGHVKGSKRGVREKAWESLRGLECAPGTGG
jgi:hypothetical protein